MRHVFTIGLIIVGLCVLGTTARGTESSNNDEAAIRTTGEAYVKTFNKGDPKALAAFWSPEAVYTNRLTGEQVIGRKAIAEQFAIIFKAANELKLDVSVESIKFISPNVAAEYGTAIFITPKSEPEEIAYLAVYVRRDGKWLLDRLTDDPKPIVQSHCKQLKELEWMIGSWVDQDENARIVTECNWTKNKNFITRSFTVSIDDQIEMSGMQIIGWDAATKQIRSWIFDSDGGYAEGVWSCKDDRWIVTTKATLPDGKIAASTSILRPLNKNSFAWQKVNRTVDGEILPNIDEVVIVRQQSQE